MADILERMKDVFTWIEQRDLRVGEIWLNPAQIVELKATEPFDAEANYTIRHMFSVKKNAVVEGYLWGARVMSSERVLVDHVVALPDGLDVTITDTTCSMPF